MIRWTLIPLLVLLIVGVFLTFGGERPAEHATTADVPPQTGSNGDLGNTPTGSASSKRRTQATSAAATGNTAQPDDEPAMLEFGNIDSHPLLSSDYAQYNTNTLNRLIVAGDATAMQVMAIRFVADQRNGKSVARAEQLMKNAAVYGATRYPFQFLARQASHELRRAAAGEIDMDEHQRRAAVRETFAYAELAGMRGNGELRDAIRRTFASRYGVEPSREEQVDIESRARGLYAEMQGRRTQLGLDPFPEPFE